MKILYAVTKANWGGAQKYVYDLATHVPRPEHDVRVLCGEGALLVEKLKAAHIPVYQLPRLRRDISFFDDVLVFFDLWKIFRRERPDVVHLNSSKIGGLGALAARCAGIKKIVFTVHGFAFNEPRSWIERKVIGFLSWLTVLFSTDVIFIAKAEYAQALKWIGVRRKAHLIYNGVEVPAFLDRDAARSELARKLNKPDTFFEQKTVIGTIAELTANKGLENAIEALKRVSECTYIIVGKGEDEQKLKTQIQKSNLESSVFLTGFIQDAPRLLKAFDIFLLPSRKEGMPYVLLEAGYASCAVIATAVGGIPEIIITNQSGILISPHNPEKIAEALRALISKPHLREAYGEALYKRVSTHFRLGIMVDKTLALYS